MASLFKLTIHTPESTVLSEDVISVTAPGAEGYLGVLAHHAPLITSLTPGKLSIRKADGQMDEYAVSGGFLEVADNHATLLADSCEHTASIDVARAHEAERRARQRLHSRESAVNVARAEAALKRAVNRQRLGDGKGK